MKIMGIVNVTPDSFSDGGMWDTPENAVAHGRSLLCLGADVLDIGGESTRPGARSLDSATEWDRIAPVVTDLAREGCVSVDTYHARTAELAVRAGAKIVNDVTGGKGDPEMFAAVADLGCEYILQHGRGNARTMNSLSNYESGVAQTVLAELLRARDRAVAAGIDAQKIILDPGLGFAKLGDQDWELLRHTEMFVNTGHRVLIGQSRKRFLQAVCGAESSFPQRDTATAVISAFLSGMGVWAVRVHNVQASAQAVATAEKLGKTRETR